jgi:hypothetical protein
VNTDGELGRSPPSGQTAEGDTFTLALVTGQNMHDVSTNVMANLGWDRVGVVEPQWTRDPARSLLSPHQVKSTGRPM